MPDFIDTPLTRLKQEYDSKLEAKDVLNAELLTRVEDAQEKLARVKGVNEMMKLMLADMTTGLSGLKHQVEQMEMNVSELRSRLPDIDD